MLQLKLTSIKVEVLVFNDFSQNVLINEVFFDECLARVSVIDWLMIEKCSKLCIVVLQLSMSLQADGEVQAVVELTDSHTECEPLVLSAAATDSSANGVVQNAAAVVADDACQELNTSLLSQSIIDASFTTAVEHHAVADGSSQTDPVTIIIGDASFLVKKVRHLADDRE